MDRVAREIGSRPNPDDDAILQRVFEIIDHLSWLKDCGCDVAGEVPKAVLEPDTKARARKIAAIDRRIAKWIKANPDPQPVNSVHSQPGSSGRDSIFERPPLRLVE